MDINKILQSLGIDFSNADSKRGAIDAIQAILGSRVQSSGTGGSSVGGQIDVELDPDLIQPSIKQSPNGDGDGDVEIEDEDDLLSQVKHNDSETTPDDETEDSTKNSQKGASEESSDESGDGSSSAESGDDTADDTSDETADASDSEDKTETDKPSEVGEEGVESDTEEREGDDGGEEIATADTDNQDEEGKGEIETDEDGTPGEPTESENGDPGDPSDSETDDEEDVEIAEDDLIDDELKGIEDTAKKAKTDARKIKRDRVLAAARNTLAKAKASKASPALIRELEKSIEALEALTEAVTKSITDISDEEFNLLVNRVFDAIDALGDKSLTFTSDDERKLRAKEIQTDITSASTQQELSAEDAAIIRAETQAIKAREKENDKYRTKARGSFKGFQDFLNSLYRAIALQVNTEETRADSWSAISRRNSGAGVLQQGKRIQELNNKKIPVIDIYVDQSGSWSDRDVEIGKKAVMTLADMEAEGKIKINLYYFANHVHTDAFSARMEGGTWAWNGIVKNVIATQATNVVIITDSDMEHVWDADRYWSQGEPARYTVPGYVWYLWKNGENAPRLPRDLKGRGGVQQFSFGSSDL